MIEQEKKHTANLVPAPPPKPPIARKGWWSRLTGETKLGLVVAGSFLALTGGVVGTKYFVKSPAPTDTGKEILQVRVPQIELLVPTPMPPAPRIEQPAPAELPPIVSDIKFTPVPNPEVVQVGVDVPKIPPAPDAPPAVVAPAEKKNVLDDPVFLPPVDVPMPNKETPIIAPPVRPPMKDDFTRKVPMKIEAPKLDPLDVPPVIDPLKIKIDPVEIKPTVVDPLKIEPVEIRPPTVDPLKIKIDPVEIKPPVVEPFKIEPVEIKPTVDPMKIKIDPIEIKPTTIELKTPIPIERANAVKKDGEYDEDMHSIKPNETYRAISKQYFNSEAYAAALQRYNRDHPGQADYVRIPPIWVLEKKYASDVNASPTRPVGYNPPPVADVTPRNDPAYTVGDNGEMLADIAKKSLGSEDAWKRIWDLNPQLNPAKMIPGGTRLKMPGQ